MITDSGFADPDEEDALLRPVWEDTPDETDADRGLPRRAPHAARRSAGADDLATLLGPVCAATDALARLDARAAGAEDAVRDGLIARLAFAEAAGFLAHTHAWAHPLDLALRAAGLTASTALAATGAGHRALPQTFGGRTAPRDWADPPFEAVADGDRAVAEALALARALRRLIGRTGAADVVDTLQGLGARAADPKHVTVCWDQVVPASAPRRHGLGRRAGEGGAPRLPPLLAAAQAAEAWMDAAVVENPTPAQALFLAAALMARTGATRAVVAPVWAAYPALGFGERAALPTLRSDAADRLAGRDQPVTWPLAFLLLVAESARMGLRELDRLEAAAARAKELAAAADRRSRLPDAIDALLRRPVLTPKALAAALKVTPQTATGLLRELQTKGLVKEVTGRGSFRAFAI